PSRGCLAAVPARRADGHAADRAPEVPRVPCATGPILGADPVPGAAAGAQRSRQLRNGAAFRASAADGRAGAPARDRPLRDATGPAEPDRLGSGADLLPPPPDYAPRVHPDAGVFSPELSRTLRGRNAEPVSRCPRASVRALWWPYPRASVRSPAH